MRVRLYSYESIVLYKLTLQKEYVMLEARDGYFEASRHMLTAMQKLATEKF